jgi:enamine deaminase RidA (YjgF/YER057c/UK114 family)
VQTSHWHKWTAALLFATMASASAFAAQKQIVRPSGTAPGGNFSPGILIEALYISGQAGEDTHGKILALEPEVQQALDNVGVVLQKAGMTAADVVSVQT